MKDNTNKYLIIGAGVVIAGYLLWKKSQNDELNKRVQNMSKLLNDKMKPSQSKSLKSRQYSMECEMRYSELRQPSVMMPPEYWEKRKEDWMKINCK
jgi:hypothetical protein